MKTSKLGGSIILLNNTANAWTQGLRFYVDEVRSWGVTCFADLDRGLAWYRATWAQIAEVVAVEKSQSEQAADPNEANLR